MQFQNLQICCKIDSLQQAFCLVSHWTFVIVRIITIISKHFFYIFSFSDTQSKHLHTKPDNIENMLELADQMAKVTSQQYTYGIAYQLNEYTADGTTFDYMAGVRKVSREVP